MEQPPSCDSLGTFTALEGTSPLLLTLLFDTKAGQHAALARIEGFYESTQDAQLYLTLEQARERRQCQHYEAFNFPLTTVRKWLGCMAEAHGMEGQHAQEGDPGGSAEDGSGVKWWKAYCNEQEAQLLDHLDNLGALTQFDSDVNNTSHAPEYLISVLSSQRAAALRHEQLHFLYHISPSYRAQVQDEHRSLSAKARKIIERDLTMRKYSAHVWVDEFQAYISQDAGEFGSSIRDECQAISQSLRRYQQPLIRQFGLY